MHIDCAKQKNKHLKRNTILSHWQIWFQITLCVNNSHFLPHFTILPHFHIIQKDSHNPAHAHLPSLQIALKKTHWWETTNFTGSYNSHCTFYGYLEMLQRFPNAGEISLLFTNNRHVFQQPFLTFPLLACLYSQIAAF